MGFFCCCCCCIFLSFFLTDFFFFICTTHETHENHSLSKKPTAMVASGADFAFIKFLCRKKVKKLTPHPLPPHSKCLIPAPAPLQGPLEASPGHRAQDSARASHGEPGARLGTFLSSWNLCKSEATALGQLFLFSHWAFPLPSGFPSLVWAAPIPG